MRFNQRRFPELPKTLNSDPVASEVSIKDMIAAVYKDLSATDVINFSVAVPALELIPAAKLNKSVLYALRNSKDSCLGYDHVQGNPDLRNQIRIVAGRRVRFFGEPTASPKAWRERLFVPATLR